MPRSIPSGIALLSLFLFCIFVGKAVSTVPFVPLIVAVSIFLFIFAFVYTDWAMVLLIFAMLLSPEFVVGAISRHRDIVVRVDDLLIVVFMLAWLARGAMAKDVRFIRKLPLNRPIFIFAAVLVLVTLKAMIVRDVVPTKGFFYIFKYVEYFMVFYLAAGVIRTRKQVVSYLKAFIIVLAIVNVYAFLQIGHASRVSAPFETSSEPNTLGGYQVLLLGIIIGVLTQARLRVWKWPLLALALFTLVPFGHTLSRASYLAIVPMYLTLILFNKLSNKMALVGFLLAAAIVFFMFRPEHIMDRFTSTFKAEYQEGIPPVEVMGVTLGSSPSARIQDWVELFHMWQQKPFFGYGLTGVRFVDSEFMKVLVETGLVGFSAFILLMLAIFRQTLRIYRNTKDDLYKGLALGFLAGHVGMLFHAITANTFTIIRIMEPYWFLAAIVMMIPELERPKTEAPKAVKPGPKEQYIRNMQFLLDPGKKA